PNVQTLLKQKTVPKMQIHTLVQLYVADLFVPDAQRQSSYFCLLAIGFFCYKFANAQVHRTLDALHSDFRTASKRKGYSFFSLEVTRNAQTKSEAEKERLEGKRSSKQKITVLRQWSW